MQNTEKIFNQLVDRANEDENILGFLLTASRGKGMITELSDYDCAMIVKDELAEKYREEFKDYGAPEVELRVFSQSQFRDYASWESSEAWDRYNFAHLEMLVDKTNGELQHIVDEKGTLPQAVIRETVISALETYLNLIYRSIKNTRDGNFLPSRLDAAESVSYILTAFFALEGRLRPYNKYLLWEFKNYPLKKIPWNEEQFKEMIMKILDTGDVLTQKQILRESETVFRNEGYGSVFDGWGEKLDWIKK